MTPPFPRFHIQYRTSGIEWKTIASFYSEGVARYALLLPFDRSGIETRLLFDDKEITSQAFFQKNILRCSRGED